MARFELKLPRMGESIAEATITNWLKQVGDKIEADEAVLEVATDKVDSEVPSEVSGVLVEQLFSKNDLVEVGQTIAIIETEGEDAGNEEQDVQRQVERRLRARPHRAVQEVAAHMAVARQSIGAGHHEQHPVEHVTDVKGPGGGPAEQVAREDLVADDEDQPKDGPGKETPDERVELVDPDKGALHARSFHNGD